ncbi:histone acetyltransferases subunit 3-domain-containing protein [Cristinia sonorae]|uniref:Histone acetyltransferases subunit 3-domain-containing protein n=1 Tax=Cristinia sonorae TaxID=1940300 RepID=A0A8K0XPN9_9AGAR|nr:histone acetyltransferases subunit 3-domain-containing protein [Cristinia sonorae]
MSLVVSHYLAPPAIRSSLVKNPSDAIPPTEELEALQSELRALKETALERSRKADDDLRMIEESMRRLKEKEKGKARALDKIKKERAFTPVLNGDDKRQAVHVNPPQKNRSMVIPSGSVASAASTPPHDPRRLAEDLKRKKKKRKRDDASDAESEPLKARKTSPLPQHTHPHPQPAPPKTVKPTAFSHPPPKAGLPDFSVPPPASLLPSRPPVQPAPIAGPSKPTEVTEDFSKSKQPNQVLVTTFYTSIEPYLRPIKEEDIGFLEHTGDDVEPLIMPQLGRHYTDVWEEEDIAVYGSPLPGMPTRASSGIPAASTRTPLPKWEPSTLTENDCMTEEHGHGPLNERLISAMIPMANAEWKGVKAAEEAMEGRPGTNGAAAQAARDKLNVADLEDRVKNVMRFHGLLDEVPDFSEAVDDPIATALRHAQRELRTVLATNKVRRERLAAIARDRLVYQEYLDGRDALDRQISALYTKLQKKDGPKANKKKKKPPTSDANGMTNGLTANGIPPPCPAALGLGPDEENKLVVPDQLNDLVEARRQWGEIGEQLLKLKEEPNPGRLLGIPKRSVFEGIEEDVQRELERLGPPSKKESSLTASGKRSSKDAWSSKGKARAKNEMEFG